MIFSATGSIDIHISHDFYSLVRFEYSPVHIARKLRIPQLSARALRLGNNAQPVVKADTLADQIDLDVTIEFHLTNTRPCPRRRNSTDSWFRRFT